MMKSRLSKAVMALVLAGAGSGMIATEFLKEKEGKSNVAYQDAGGVWTICYGETEGVRKGMYKTDAECDALLEARVEENQRRLDILAPGVTMSEPERAAIISFCTYNIGSGKCSSSTFLAMLKRGDRVGACKQILRWVYDGGRDCNVRSNNCYGQVSRRLEETELCMLD